MTPSFAPLVPSWYRPPGIDDDAFFGVAPAIIRRASRLTGMTAAEIKGASRNRDICFVRWAVMVALRRHGQSLPRIGRALGRRDHTTVMHGLGRAEELLDTDPRFVRLCRELAI